MVWPYIQQRCGTLLPSPWLRPCLLTLLTYLPSLAVVRDFGFTLNEVNWLGNIVSCVYVLAAFLTPIITKRYGLKRCVWTVSHLMQCIFSSRLRSVTLLLCYFYPQRGSVTLELHGRYPRMAPMLSSLPLRWGKQLFLPFSSYTFVRHFLQSRYQYSRF